MLTAKQLGITPAERKAAIWVRNALESGRIDKSEFDMSCTGTKGRLCGSVGCIGAWMSLHMQGKHENPTTAAMNKASIYVMDRGFEAYEDNPLQDLFFPPSYEKTPKQAIKVIDKFLNTGKVRW